MLVAQVGPRSRPYGQLPAHQSCAGRTVLTSHAPAPRQARFSVRVQVSPFARIVTKPSRT